MAVASDYVPDSGLCRDRFYAGADAAPDYFQCLDYFSNNSNQFNPKNAQLIFSTHDTNRLSSGLFRRDQIWFTSKDKYGGAKLYSLADFKSDEVRKNESLENNYIRGKYGAVPYLGLFDILNVSLLRDENEKQKG